MSCCVELRSQMSCCVELRVTDRHKGDFWVPGMCACFSNCPGINHTCIPHWGIPDWGIPDWCIPDWGIPDASRTDASQTVLAVIFSLSCCVCIHVWMCVLCMHAYIVFANIYNDQCVHMCIIMPLRTTNAAESYNSPNSCADSGTSVCFFGSQNAWATDTTKPHGLIQRYIRPCGLVV
jgi:hypothetical protein